jgi:hypothetical protein
MLATILIIVMILLQTGALSLGLMAIPRFAAAASLKRKSALLTNVSGNGPKGAGPGNREVLYAFSSTRSDLDRNWCSPRDG